MDQIDCLEGRDARGTLDRRPVRRTSESTALHEDAARLPHGSERENLLQLAEGYRLLADMKRMVLRKVNDMSKAP
jgi:hypothetical protein